jgi:hypothetical protein
MCSETQDQCKLLAVPGMSSEAETDASHVLCQGCAVRLKTDAIYTL